MSPKVAPTLGAIVLAAGRSTRFKGASAKVLHPLVGKPLVLHVLDTLRELHKSSKLKEVCVVVSPGREVSKALDGIRFPFPVTFAVQRERRGTGDATQVGLKKLTPVDDVLVLAGDAPLVRANSLLELVEKRRTDQAAGALLTAVLDDPGPYGRILRKRKRIVGIVEARDATPEQASIKEINTCILVYTREALTSALPRLSSDNAQKEKYLTDVVGILIGDGEQLSSVEGHQHDVLGTNTRAEYATIARLARERILNGLMDAGVTILDPDTTYIDAGVVVGPDTTILPNTYL
ncbi:MAG: NTP transferase domain-containing protein, partial [Actinomycetota bacterium]